MRNLVERLALLSFAGLVACTGGQGGDPGQSNTDGGGGMGPAGEGGGGTGGMGGGGTGGIAGASSGSGGSAGCTPGLNAGVGIVSAKLEGEAPRLQEMVALHDEEYPAGVLPIGRELLQLQRFGSDLIALGQHTFWLIELGEPVRAQRVESGDSLYEALPYDFDGDGDDDVLGYGERMSEGRARLWERDGEALIEHESFGLWMGYRPDALTAADVDGDGDLDIVSLDAQGPLVMRNDGAFDFARIEGSAELGECATCTPVAVGLHDIDGDDALDLVAVLDLSQQVGDVTWVSVQRGDGTGVFGEATLTEVWGAFSPDRVFYADINRDSYLDVVLSRRAARDVTLAIYGGADGAFLPAEPLDHHIDDLVDADDDGELDTVSFEDSALVLRYARGGDLFDERRYALSLTSVRTKNLAIEPARGGDAPKVHVLLQPDGCAFECTAACGACVFDACVECLNHDDCGSGECQYGRCFTLPEQDAGVH